MFTHEFENPDRRPRIDRRGVLRAGSVLLGATALLNTSVGGVSARLARTAETDATNIDMGTTWKAVSSKSAPAMCFAPAGSARTPTSAPATPLIAWRLDRGTIDGIDVSGRMIALINHIPGNVLAGNWSVVFFVDEARRRSSTKHSSPSGPARRAARSPIWRGLFGNVKAVERVPITFLVDGAAGNPPHRRRDDPDRRGRTRPLPGCDGNDDDPGSIRSSRRSPARLPTSARPCAIQRASSQLGLKDIDLRGHNAIQGSFRFTA